MTRFGYLPSAAGLTVAKRRGLLHNVSHLTWLTRGIVTRAGSMAATSRVVPIGSGMAMPVQAA